MRQRDSIQSYARRVNHVFFLVMSSIYVVGQTKSFNVFKHEAARSYFQLLRRSYNKHIFGVVDVKSHCMYYIISLCQQFCVSWWRHQMETYSALLALRAGNSPVTGEFPPQRPVTRSVDVSLICALNKRLSKQSWCLWFETPSRSLWRH